MIIDKIENIGEYSGLSPLLYQAFSSIPDFLARFQPVGRLDGKEEILYANCMQIETSTDSDRLWEMHRDYIDVHVVVEGSEVIQLSALEVAKIETPYNEQIDASMYTAESIASFLAEPGWFVVFFPGEIHRAGTAAKGKSTQISKFVMKIKVCQ